MDENNNVQPGQGAEGMGTPAPAEEKKTMPEGEAPAAPEGEAPQM